MPRTAFPPTPASSTEIKGQDGTQRLATPQMALELPPPALHAGGIMSTPFLQASETVKSRRRASVAQRTVEGQFALPPPPVPSRKIIQMKPGEDDAVLEAIRGSAPEVMVMTGRASSEKTTDTKRKQPSATSAAGRKAARKTAHSLIERRRRSKINDEFSVLKDMVPACTGEMHKLTILQASIEYIRYLQDCVGQLKAQRPDPAAAPGPSRDDGESDDVDMGGFKVPSRRLSTASLSSEPHRHHHYSYSATTSPAFGPQESSPSAPSSSSSSSSFGYDGQGGSPSAAGSTLTSPALLPQRDVDREVTAALLMLNQADRRGPTARPGGRGMSVRDLLTS